MAILRILLVNATVLALTILLVLSTGSSAIASGGRVLWVANDGVDSINCGSRSSQCRSISQAIDNAIDGDRIAVGTGLYGDLNGDGTMSGPGEERQDPLSDCNVCITKAVWIFSLHGADMTVIRGNRTGGYFPVVEIGASGANFGAVGRGFTLTGAGIGVNVLGLAANVTIAGNISVDNSDYGFSVFSSGESIRLTDNRAINSRYGFYIQLTQHSILQHNTAVRNQIAGFLIGAVGNLQLIGNTALHNGDRSPLGDLANGSGFWLIGTGSAGPEFLLRDNTANGNAGVGFQFGRPSAGDIISVPSLSHNTAVGNGGPGVLLRQGVTVHDFHASNIFGNSIADPSVLGRFPPNCGVFNETGTRVDATGNFWGLVSGPGPDPADAVGGSCDINGSITLFKPFATAFQ
jgi:parallel beta-helix repeat protein